MIKVLALLLCITSVHAYVPTVESLFRFGSNSDVSANGLSLTLIIKKLQPGEKAINASGDASLFKDDKNEDYFKLFFTKNGEILKVAQTRYKDSSFSEASLEHKVFLSNFSPYTIKSEHAEKGVFFALLHSLTLNDGAHMVNFLKSLNVPVKLNSEIINREKVEFMADYKRYLMTVGKDRNARKTEVNPMRPEDANAQNRADEIMGEPMYTDTKQVKLAKDEGKIAWIINAGDFEAVVSYNSREVQKIKYKSPTGEFEIVCKDYWLANGTHAVPRFLLIKGLNGQSYQVEITNLRHYVEKEDDLVRRLRNWDQILKGKESAALRPEFML